MASTVIPAAVPTPGKYPPVTLFTDSPTFQMAAQQLRSVAAVADLLDRGPRPPEDLVAPEVRFEHRRPERAGIDDDHLYTCGAEAVAGEGELVPLRIQGSDQDDGHGSCLSIDVSSPRMVQVPWTERFSISINPCQSASSVDDSLRFAFTPGRAGPRVP